MAFKKKKMMIFPAVKPIGTVGRPRNHPPRLGTPRRGRNAAAG